VAENHGWLHLSASEVIRGQRADAIAKVGKLVANVDANQDLLLRGIEVHRSSSSSSSILLDGHFALRVRDGSIQRLPTSVFAALQLDGIACFLDDPTAITQRLRERDQQKVNEEDVATLQQQELMHAQEVAKALALSLEVLPAFDSAALSRLVASSSNSFGGM
jgi:adenylate kinase